MERQRVRLCGRELHGSPIISQAPSGLLCLPWPTNGAANGALFRRPPAPTFCFTSQQTILHSIQQHPRQGSVNSHTAHGTGDINTPMSEIGETGHPRPRGYKGPLLMMYRMIVVYVVFVARFEYALFLFIEPIEGALLWVAIVCPPAAGSSFYNLSLAFYLQACICLSASFNGVISDSTCTCSILAPPYRPALPAQHDPDDHRARFEVPHQLEPLSILPLSPGMAYPIAGDSAR